MRPNFINRTAVFILAALLLFVPMVVSAQTIEGLQQADKLRIKVWLEPEQNIIAKQQVKLNIEVATDKWFSGGARIGRFEIEDAIVLQREKFAVNSTRQEDDKSWTVQQWTLVIYPQRDGQFTVPVIPLNLSIAGENLEDIIGKANTRPMIFDASIPIELQDKDSWIATTRYEVTSSFNKSIDELKPGDALIRSIHLSADDLPAMMLPKVDAEDIPGVAIYQKPAQVTDKVNRGDYLAERIETLTYVFEKPGEYQLPAQSFYWWNLDSGTLETIELPATTLGVSRSSAAVDVADDSQQQSVQDRGMDVINLLSKLGAVFVLLIIVWFIGNRLLCYIKNKKSAKPVELSEKSLQRKFNKACRDKDSKKAIQLLYQWLDAYGGESFQGSIRRRLIELDRAQTMKEFNCIMQSVYSLDKDYKIDLRQFSNEFIGELKQTGQPGGMGRWGIELKLN